MSLTEDRSLERVARWLATATAEVNDHDLAPVVLARLVAPAPTPTRLTAWWLRQPPEWHAVPVAASLCLAMVSAWLLTAGPHLAPTDLSALDPDLMLDLLTAGRWFGGGP